MEQPYIYPYLVLIPVTLATAAILIVLFIPRLIISLWVTLNVLTSKFRNRCYVKLEKDFLASYLERGNINNTEASVLFLHGFSGSAIDLVSVLPKLPEKYHVVGIDLPNHGYSTCRLDKVVTPEDMARLVKKFVEKTDLHRRKFHLVGYSYGTRVGAYYASQYPDDIASLVLAAPPHILEHGPVRTDFTIHSNEELLAILDFTSSNNMKHPPPLFVRALVNHKNYVAPNMVKVGQNFQFTPGMLKKIETKTLLLWGDKDQVCLPRGIDHFKEHLPNFSVSMMKGCDHLMFITHVQDVADNLNRWLSAHAQQPTVSRSQGLKPSMR